MASFSSTLSREKLPFFTITPFNQGHTRNFSYPRARGRGRLQSRQEGVRSETGSGGWGGSETRDETGREEKQPTRLYLEIALLDSNGKWSQTP